MINSTHKWIFTKDLVIFEVEKNLNKNYFFIRMAVLP